MKLPEISGVGNLVYSNSPRDLVSYIGWYISRLENKTYRR